MKEWGAKSTGLNPPKADKAAGLPNPVKTYSFKRGIGFLFGGFMKKIALILVISLLMPLIPAQDVASSAIIYKGIASWYSENDPGILKTTANMEIFDDSSLTCAMWDVPFNTCLKVTNLENGKSIIVRVNDRGPAKRLVQKGRIIDLTQHAFSQIADLTQGLIKVKIEII